VISSVSLTPLAAKSPLPTSSIALLRQLEWRMKQAVENPLSGEYRSVFRGRGMEFDQVVRYTFGDDIRDIDWNVTARLGEPFRKKFVEERELTVLIVFEDTLSLQFGSGERTKRAALLELASLAMMLSAANRDRVGIVHAYPGGYKLTQPVRGRGPILNAVADLIGRPLPVMADGQPVETPWKFISHATTNHSLLLWLGDFPPRAAPAGWTQIRTRFQPIGFRVEDEWERVLPVGKAVTAFDPTCNRLVVLDPNSKTHRDAHAAWSAEREAAFTKLFPDRQSRLVVTPDESMIDALVKFFHAHRRVRR
jgi:hypothetical protein